MILDNYNIPDSNDFDKLDNIFEGRISDNILNIVKEIKLVHDNFGA